MATITIISQSPFSVNIQFSDLELKAMMWDANSQGADFQTFISSRAVGYVDAAVRRYKEAVTNVMLSKFNAATPEQQQAALDALGGLPSI